MAHCLRVSVTDCVGHREHVLSDLEPYVCTYPGCHLENYLFDTVDAWFVHETQAHRVELSCQTPGHEPFTSQTRFREHLRIDHNLALGGSAEELQLFQRPVKSPYGNCNLCFTRTSNTKRHVSRHLRQIALFALPRADYYAGEDEGDERTQAMHYSAAVSSTSSETDSSQSLIGPDVDQLDASMPEPNPDAIDTLTEPPLTAEPSSWDNIQTYGVLHAREGRSDQPPDALPNFREPDLPPTRHPNARSSLAEETNICVTGDF